jgi:hypothetical protein
MAVRAVVTDTSFDVTLTGWDAVWSLRRHASIPLDDVVSAKVIDRKEAVNDLRWRLGGTYWPGAVCCGNYSLRTKDGRGLACFYRDSEVLEVRTALTKPRLVLLQLPDRHDIAWILGERIG